MLKDKKKVLIALGVLTLCIGSLTATFMVMNNRTTDTTQPSGGRDIVDVNGNVDDGSLPFEDPEKVKEELQRRVDESMLALKINTNPIFPTADSEGTLAIENSSNNRYNFQVEIRLDDTSELVYTSPLLEPGTHILNDKLHVQLEKGEYEATALFFAYDKDNNFIGQAGAGLTIAIEG